MNSLDIVTTSPHCYFKKHMGTRRICFLTLGLKKLIFSTAAYTNYMGFGEMFINPLNSILRISENLGIFSENR